MTFIQKILFFSLLALAPIQAGADSASCRAAGGLWIENIPCADSNATVINGVRFDAGSSRWSVVGSRTLVYSARNLQTGAFTPEIVNAEHVINVSGLSSWYGSLCNRFETYQGFPMEYNYVRMSGGTTISGPRFSRSTADYNAKGPYASECIKPPVVGRLATIADANDLISAPTTKDAIAMADLVYASAISDSIPTGYKLDPLQVSVGDLRVVAFQSLTEPERFIVSVRGSTPNVENWTGNLGFSGAPNETLASYVNQTAGLIRDLITEHPNIPTLDVTLTGHSLGGGIAQIIGANTGYPAITFNAPGVGNVAGRLAAQSAIPGRTPPATYDNLVNFSMQGDPVSEGLSSTALGSARLLQLGTVVRVRTDALGDVLRLGQPMLDPLGSAISTLYGGYHNHSMVTMAGQLGSSPQVVSLIGFNGEIAGTSTAYPSSTAATQVASGAMTLGTLPTGLVSGIAQVASSVTQFAVTYLGSSETGKATSTIPMYAYSVRMTNAARIASFVAPNVKVTGTEFTLETFSAGAWKSYGKLYPLQDVKFTTPVEGIRLSGIPEAAGLKLDSAFALAVKITGATSISATTESLPKEAFVVPAGTRLGNIATRAPVLTGDNVMIGGFILQGSKPKKVLVTARGPSMAAQGVTGTLSDPFLTLYSGATPIATNDDFGSASNAAEIPATMKPANAKESAILTTLSPGAYTAIVTGVNGATGIGIVEAFEVDTPETPLINIATRAPVLTGDNVMIGGFIISGDAPKTVVIRARGPSLAAAGVPGVLADPTMTLYAGATVIASNDDWGADVNAAAIQSSGFAPSDAKESALRMTLNPGAYTVIVTGANGSTGIGIVEVFAQ